MAPRLRLGLGQHQHEDRLVSRSPCSNTSASSSRGDPSSTSSLGGFLSISTGILTPITISPLTGLKSFVPRSITTILPGLLPLTPFLSTTLSSILFSNSSSLATLAQPSHHRHNSSHLKLPSLVGRQICPFKSALASCVNTGDMVGPLNMHERVANVAARIVTRTV
ncbi:hypothetical protein EDB81DRAFT_67646 [Dactylonectria macrodidyma]|uniref:Uncharacterized protein n=1 Tax=Dactylonectria macrodidyma TaxID=307937 RepID=A0A9P9J3Q3_9HYPO|nr:hypothetical protein EDB81DRAFT_67646 [Dactylonectria macrodidyma]